jgi:membrane fusion protein (multidrug efflux system)
MKLTGISIERRSDDMTTGTRWIRTLSLAGVAVLAACGRGGEDTGAGDSTPGGDSQPTYTRVINVETMALEARPFSEVIRLTGVVQANQDVTLAAEESGVIREILVEKGNPVRKGQALMRIDDQLLRGQVDQARAQAQLAQETWERRKRLWEEDRVGSEIAYLEAKFAAEQTSANLRVLEERLSRHTIRAPISGVLDSRSVEVGSMVQPGMAVARVISLNPAKVTAGVPERFALDVEKGVEAVVTLEVFPGESRSAEVSYVGATVDPRNRTFPVEVTLDNSDGRIKPEMIASVELVRRAVQDALVVPQEALIRVEDGFVVFVVDGEGEEAVARVHTVELGPAQRNQVVVRTGLEVGDRVVVNGQKDVADGDRVKVVGERQPKGGEE